MVNSSGTDAPGSTAPSPARTCALDGCDLAADRDVPGDSLGRTFFCSTSHRTRSGWLKVATTARCAVCLTTFRHDTPGRPPVYCSTECKSARARQLDRATKALARGDDSGSPHDLLDDALLLWSVWGGREGDDVVHKYWPMGRPPKPTTTPSAAARRALRERVNRLRAEVRDLDRAAKHSEHKAAEQADREFARKVSAKRRADDEQALSDELKALAKDGGVE